MTWCRRAILLLLPLLVLVSIPERPTSAVQPAAAVTFPPADVPERNDIVLDNRVPIPMRDGVSLYADVYRPVGKERYPVIVSRTPYRRRQVRATSARSSGVRTSSSTPRSH
jgi:predicted acyl esterase